MGWIQHGRAIVLAACAALAGQPAEAGTNELFIDGGIEATARTSSGDPDARKRTVRIDSAAFDAALETGDLSVGFFEDASWETTVVDVQATSGGTVVIAKIPDDPHSSVIIARHGDSFAGDLRTMDGRRWSLRPAPGGLHIVEEVDADGSLPCAGTPVPPGPLFPDSLPRVSSPTESGAVIDVLVVWTMEARLAAGGESAMRALVDLAMADANQAYANSLVQQRVALVGAKEVGSYASGTRSATTVLGDLKTPGDGLLDEVHVLRDYHRADVVALLVDTLVDACGIAYLLANFGEEAAEIGFSATDKDCIATSTFVHELGHNMGCSHDRANAAQALFPYSYGWKWNGTSAGSPLHRSIMAYPPGSRTGHFSNPEVMYDGAPTGSPVGQPNAANNAATLGATAATVASFRISNDNFAQRIAVDGARRSFITSTYGRTIEPQEPIHAGVAGGRSLWWSWVATEDGPILARTSGSAVDTVLAAYTGTSLESLVPAAANDDAAQDATWSEIAFAATGGTEYHFAVDSKGGAQGAIAFALYPGPQAETSRSEILRRSFAAGQAPGSTTFTVRNVGAGTLDWRVSSNASWMSFSPESGSSTGEADSVMLSWNFSGLADGIHTEDILVDGDGGASPQPAIRSTLELAREPSECSLVPTQGSGSAGGVYTGVGNVISVAQSATLRRFSVTMNSGNSVTLRYHILEGNSASGPFTGISQTELTTFVSAVPVAISTGYLDVPLVPGKYYAIVVSWATPSVTVRTDNGNPTTFPLGTVHGGVSSGLTFTSYLGQTISPPVGASRYRMEFCLDTGDPEISVHDSSQSDVPNGSRLPALSPRMVGDPPPEIDFTIRNDGTRQLPLAQPTMPPGFELVEGVPEFLQPSESDTFTLRMQTDQPGGNGGAVAIINGDSDESLYTFSVYGAVRSPDDTDESWDLH